MTLQNGLIHKGRAYLWTDEMGIDEHGNRLPIAKAMTGLAWPWAAIHSGMVLASDQARVSRLIGLKYPRNPAELIEACRHALRTEMEAGRPGRLLVAHSFRAEGSRMFLMANDEVLCVPGVAPYEVHETVQFACSASDERWTREFAARDFDLLDMRQFIDEQVKRPMETPLAYGGEFGGSLIELRVAPGKRVRAQILREIDSDPNVMSGSAHNFSHRFQEPIAAS